MKNLLLTIVVLACINLRGQHTISGTLSPASQFKWLIAYHLKPGTQDYVAQSVVRDGNFILEIPENAGTGTYRIVYAIPQNEFYFDVIYNGKEDIELTFDTKSGVSFSTSQENILFNTYFKEINDLELQLIDYYGNGNSQNNTLNSLVERIKKVQSSYEGKTSGMIANEFITSNQPYIPQNNEDIYEFVKGKKDNYFDHLKLDSPNLQASGFLTNKLINYVFTALPLENMSSEKTENAIKENVDTVNHKLQKVNEKFKLHLFHSLWSQAVAVNQNGVCDYIFATYLKKLAKNVGDQEIINAIELHNRLRIGAIAPDLEWNKDNKKTKLSELTGAENYLLVFWSSTCSHCIRELPALHKELASNDKVKVVAIGLEDDELDWEKEIKKLNQFDHVLALGKWDSEYANLYAIDKTPTYFILDHEKRIVAKPGHDKDVVDYFAEN